MEVMRRRGFLVQEVAQCRFANSPGRGKRVAASARPASEGAVGDLASPTGYTPFPAFVLVGKVYPGLLLLERCAPFLTAAKGDDLTLIGKLRAAT